VCIQACDIVEEPFEETPTTTTPPTSAAKKVLVEEFTGHQCGNCPAVSASLHDLKTQAFPDQLITILIHTGSLARPKTSGTKFLSDYRTQAGDDIASRFSLPGVPFGLVNRVGGLQASSEWASSISLELQEAPVVSIEIDNSFDASSRVLTSEVTTTYLENSSDQDYLVLALIEDNVVDWQKDYSQNPQDVPDYNHHDLFRGNINSTWGDQLSTASIGAGEIFTKSYTYTLPADYDASNCKVVAYVRNADSDEIVNAEEVALQP